MKRLKPIDEYTQSDIDQAWIAQLKQTAKQLGIGITEATIFDGRTKYSTPDGENIVKVVVGQSDR